MKISGFIGNERIIEQFGCLIDAGRFPHAVVIEGAEGLGKKTLARLLATALVCHGEEKPCMECTQCHKAMEKLHPDIFEYSAAGGANSFHVDVIRDVIKDAYVQPNEAEYKVYILGNADCMSISAQNALLKVLEEPPKYVVFILTARSKSMLLETVLSRSVVVTLEGVNADEGALFISSQIDEVSYEKAKIALETFNGNIGKAIGSFSDGKENELAEICCNICKSLVNSSEYELLCACSVFQKDRNSVIFACDFLKNIFRDALVYNENSECLSGQKDTAILLKTKLTGQKLVDLMNVCDTLKEMALMNSNNSILITKICYSLRQAAGR